MKEYVCSCGRRRLVEDFVVMVICSRCLKEEIEFLVNHIENKKKFIKEMEK